MNTARVIKNVKFLLTDAQNHNLNNIILDCAIRVNGKVYKTSCELGQIVQTVFRMIDKPHLLGDDLKGKPVDSIFIQHQNGKVLYDSKTYSADIQKVKLVKSKDTQIKDFVAANDVERQILLDDLATKIEKDTPSLEKTNSPWDDLPMNDLPFLT